MDWEKRRDISNGIEDQIISELKKNIDRIDGIILSDYDKGVLTPRLAKEVIKISNEYGKIVVVDPKPKNSLNYKGVITSYSIHYTKLYEFFVKFFEIASEDESLRKGLVDEELRITSYNVCYTKLLRAFYF